MASLTLLDIVKFIYNWMPVLLGLVSFAFGVMTLFGRNKNLRLLGVWVVLAVITAITGNAYKYCRILYDAGLLESGFYFDGPYQIIITVSAVITFVLMIAQLVSRWLYTRRSYKTGKGVLIAVILLSVAGPFLRLAANKLLADNTADIDGYRLSVYSASVSVIFDIAVLSVFMYVFFKNRKQEKFIPSFWVFELLFLIRSAISFLFDVGMIDYRDSDNYAIIYMLAHILLAFLFPVASIYLFKGSITKDARRTT